MWHQQEEVDKQRVKLVQAMEVLIKTRKHATSEEKKKLKKHVGGVCRVLAKRCPGCIPVEEGVM